VGVGSWSWSWAWPWACAAVFGHQGSDTGRLHVLWHIYSAAFEIQDLFNSCSYDIIGNTRFIIECFGYLGLV